MKVLIVEDDMNCVYQYKQIVERVIPESKIVITNSAIQGLWLYAKTVHDILLIDDQLIGPETGMEFLQIIDKALYRPKLILSVSSSRYLKKYEGEFFDVYTGKSSHEIEKALLRFESFRKHLMSNLS